MTTTETAADVALAAVGVVVWRGRRRVLDGVTMSARPGELVGVIGPSGGGKSTLLSVLAGTLPVDDGAIVLAAGARVGLVPQDDIIHLDLPLRRTLMHAARLRLPATADVDTAVDAVLAVLELGDHAETPVGRLSGGQRKRASIAVELLDQPAVLLLDEPTAGLDPSTARALLRVLRSLADAGCAVVMTTHRLDDLAAADHVVVVRDGGAVELPDATAATASLAIVDVDVEFERAGDVDDPDRHVALPPRPHGTATRWRQWRSLTWRNAEVLARGRITLAVLLGVPLLVVAMFAVLFEPGTFDHVRPVDHAAATSVAYWLAFAGFFFGLTYGLLQICTEVTVARRERFAGVGIAAYLGAKAAVLVPMLVVVNAALIAALRATDRLPAETFTGTLTLLGILLLDSTAALALGLMLSALVTDTAQAAMALPMVCFPAVLFAGAIVPVDQMAAAGRVISIVTPARWAFESVARHLDVPVAASATAFVPTLALVATTVVLATAASAAASRRL